MQCEFFFQNSVTPSPKKKKKKNPLIKIIFFDLPSNLTPPANTFQPFLD